MNQDHTASRSIMIVAGEASGDLHGAKLVSAMKKEDGDLYFFGVGGTTLREAGVEIIVESDEIAVMGLAEIFSSLRHIHRILTDLKKLLSTQKPDLLILIDFAEFNMRLAKAAHKLGIPVFYYITPKVWVWRKKRAKKLARYVSKAGVILPFEEQYLKDRGVDAHYVGNPIRDSVTRKFGRSEFCRLNGIDESKALVGLLPGSRKKEVAYLLPVFLEAARRMQQKYSKELVFLIPLASTLKEDDLIAAGIEKYRQMIDIHIVSENRYELMGSCDAAMAASGTVTLELAILDVPMVVAYKFSPLTYLIGKFLIHIPHFSLVNIIGQKEVVTELLQDQVRPETVEIELARVLFDDGVRNVMKTDLATIRDLLGEKGASVKAAELAFATINAEKSHG